MKTYTFEMLRTYSTLFEIEANSQQDAINKFYELGDSIYTEEMKQCVVSEEIIKGDKYARMCSNCGNGMNEGYLANGCEYYCSADCLNTEYSADEWADMADESSIHSAENYWTEWDDEEDYQYQIINHQLEEIN